MNDSKVVEADMTEWLPASRAMTASRLKVANWSIMNKLVAHDTDENTTMSWETGVAIAEIFGAAGVIITLAYLAHQIAQTNRISKAAVIRELEQKYIDLYTQVLTNTELAELTTELRDPSYTADSKVEQEKMDMFALLVVSIWLSVQVSYDQGQIDQKTFQIYHEDVDAKLSQWPAIRPHMKRILEAYPSTMNVDLYKPIFK